MFVHLEETLQLLFFTLLVFTSFLSRAQQYMLTTISILYIPTNNISHNVNATVELKLWNIATRRNLGSVPRAHKGFIRGVTINTEGQILTCGDDKVVKLWDVPNPNWEDANEVDFQEKRSSHSATSYSSDDEVRSVNTSFFISMSYFLLNASG